jgi:DNA-binding HxlR family transcriptional regulator
MKKEESTNNQNKIYLESICPMGYALGMIGNRWKPLILFKLIDRSLRFNELRVEIPLISERMLTLSLRELEKDQLIFRKDLHIYPKNVTYSLTSIASELNSILSGICEWGALARDTRISGATVSTKY